MPFSVPKKPTTFFENPLDRPEISSSEDRPLIVRQVASIQEAVKNTAVPKNGAPSSLWEKHLPALWKPANNSPTEEKKTFLTSPPPPVVAPKNTAPTPTQERKKLPDEIKQIFETNSSNFASYAKNNGGKKDMLPLEKTASALDEWDRALLLGEYPTAAPKRPQPKRVSFESAAPPVLVPKKIDAEMSGTPFPSRIMDEGVASPVPHIKISGVTSTPIKPVSVAQIIPQKPKNALGEALEKLTNKKTAAFSALVIPIKPKQSSANTGRPMDSLELSIPKKSVATPLPETMPQTTDDTHKVPPPNMSETLVEKIIEGQMRGVFENAPPLLQKELEKTTVREILSAPDERATKNNIENEVWKKRLREYLLGLQAQAGSVFSDTNGVGPIEGELVLDYVKRIYPTLLKARVLKQ